MATRLRLARLARGLTLYDLGQIVGVDQTFIHQLEVERKGPSGEMARRLAAALGLEVDDIFPGLSQGEGGRHERAEAAQPR